MPKGKDFVIPLGEWPIPAHVPFPPPVQYFPQSTETYQASRPIVPRLNLDNELIRMILAVPGQNGIRFEIICQNVKLCRPIQTSGSSRKRYRI
jgi:hypothetical protein